MKTFQFLALALFVLAQSGMALSPPPGCTDCVLLSPPPGCTDCVLLSPPPGCTDCAAR